MLRSTIKPLKKDTSLPDSDPANYRPVAMVCALSKVLELAMKERVQFGDSRAQYAYKTGTGVRDALKAVLVEMKTLKINRGKVYAVWLDLSKAFDMLRYNTILESTVCDHVTKRVLGHFLTGCSVEIGKEPPMKCTRGVRQGGLISPLLFTNVANEFLNYIDSLDTELGRVIGYADDFMIISDSPEWISQILQLFE